MESKQSLFSRLKAGLARTRDNLFSRVFHAEACVDDDFYDELEEAMILADMGMDTAQRLLSELRARLKTDRVVMQSEAREILVSLVADAMRPKASFAADAGNAVLLIVGVNGVGKTTTVGKLAYQYKQLGRKPMLAAADTFRAAAAEQLGEWASRADVPMVRHGEGADPSAVVFDAIASARAKGCDLLLCDTAGRLHNKVNLLNELGKMRRVIARELPDTPCETLLVLDATTGQNAVAQARAFSEVTPLTGVILTKLDGSAKGGVVVSIASELGVPVRFVGVGEGIHDLMAFSPEDFARALISCG